MCVPVLQGNRPLATLMTTLMASLVVLLAACRASPPAPSRVAGGDARRGQADFVRIGCGACHVVSSIRTAVGTVGPPLSDFGRRVFIAGEIPNTPEGLVQWIKDPQAIEPGTAMPDLGVSEQEARDLAAYLLTLQGG